MVKTTKKLERIIGYLQERIVDSRILGREPLVYVSDLNKQEEKLVEADYIVWSAEKKTYVVRGAVLDTIQSVKPDILDHVKKSGYEAGQNLYQFTLGERKHILESPEDYHFFLRTPEGLKGPLSMSEMQASDLFSVAAIFVIDIETEEYIHHTNLEKDINRGIVQELPDYLQKIGILGETDTDLISTSGTAIIPTPGWLGQNPNEWERRVADNINYTKQRILHTQRVLEALQRIQAEVEKRGGWSKFLTELKEHVTESLKGE